jgi:hypothetical protein
MCSVYKSSEVEWDGGLGAMCVIGYCMLWFTHYLVYLVVFNTDWFTLGSTNFWVSIVYNLCSWFSFVILSIEGCLECCMLLCMMCVILCHVCDCIVLYCTLLYCTVLYCPVLHSSTLPPGINPFSSNNNNNNNNDTDWPSLVVNTRFMFE